MGELQLLASTIRSIRTANGHVALLQRADPLDGTTSHLFHWPNHPRGLLNCGADIVSSFEDGNRGHCSNKTARLTCV